MQGAIVLEGLSSLMQRILDLLADGRKSLEVPEATQWRAVALARWDMLRALDKFIAYKETWILDPLIAEGARPQAEQALAIKRENDALKVKYVAFVQRWALNGPLSLDAPYKAEALQMATVIERQMIADVQELETLVRATAA